MAKIFAAYYSTLDPFALGAMISERYGMNDVHCKLITRGVGDTYLVDSEAQKYILRAYRSSHRNLHHITAELELLVALEVGGVSVSYPIKDTSGRYIQALNAVEGERHVVLFSYAPGSSVTTLNKMQLRELGHQMARFHNISSVVQLSDKRWNLDLDNTIFKPLEMLKGFYREDPEGYEWLASAAGKVKEKLNRLDVAGFSSGYCHYDFLPKNFHFKGDSVTLFDFDFLGYGWLVNDIMTFWQHLCLDVHFGRMTQEDADEAYGYFINAYREIRDLSNTELEVVPYLSLGFWLFYMSFHTTHDQFCPYVEPAHLKLRTNLVKQVMERYWPQTDI